MSNSIGPVTPALPAAPVAPAAQSAAAPSTAKATASPTVADTVQISSAAQALAKENVETPAQTAHEASAGDQQAIRLLAKHHHATQHTSSK